MENVSTRINKLSRDIDNQRLKRAVQDCYIEAMEVQGDFTGDPEVWEYALNEAHRLSQYHENQAKKYETERGFYLAAQEHERSRTLNSEPLKQQEENTMTDEQTTVETVEAGEGQDAPQVETSEPAETATESTPSEDSAPVEAG